MAANFLISGTGPSTSKTMAGCAIAFALKVRGLRVGVMKPVETGCALREGILLAADAEALRAAASCDQPLDRISLYRYRSPLAPIAAANADGSTPPAYNAIAEALGQIRAASDTVIVEEAHCLGTPLGGAHDYASLAAAFGLELILVIANRFRFVRNHQRRHRSCKLAAGSIARNRALSGAGQSRHRSASTLGAYLFRLAAEYLIRRQNHFCIFWTGHTLFA